LRGPPPPYRKKGHTYHLVKGGEKSLYSEAPSGIQKTVRESDSGKKKGIFDGESILSAWESCEKGESVSGRGEGRPSLRKGKTPAPTVSKWRTGGASPRKKTVVERVLGARKKRSSAPGGKTTTMSVVGKIWKGVPTGD